MLISPSHRFIFFKPMKCAGSSVEHELFKQCTGEALCTGGVNLAKTGWEYSPQNNEYPDGTRFHGHTWPDLFFSMIKRPDVYNDYRKISIVRNPWEQLVSFYWWNMGVLRTQSPELEFDEADSRAASCKKFKAYLNRVESIKGYRSNVETLLVSPLEFMSTHNEKFVSSTMTDYIRFENLDHDFTNLCESLGLSHQVRLGHIKGVHRRSPRHYSYYYDSVTIKQVQEAYPKTINGFKYAYESR